MDLTTQPNTKECKTVTFKTPNVTACREKQDEVCDEKLESTECKNNSPKNILDAKEDKFNLDGHDTDEIDDDESDEIPCSQMRRIP